MLFYVESSYSCFFFVIGIVRTLCIQPFYTPWYCLSCNWINDPIFQGKFSNSFYVTRVLASFEFSVQRALLELHTLECMYMYIVWLPKLSSSLCSFFCWRQIASNKWDHNKTVWLPQLSCTSTITTGSSWDDNDNHLPTSCCLFDDWLFFKYRFGRFLLNWETNP